MTNHPLPDRLSLEQIRDFWQDQAVRHGQSYAASWSDRPVIEMEIRELLARLSDGDRVLDVGCANGYSTVQFAAERRLSIRGIDYIPEMIEQAKARVAELGDRLLGDLEFSVGDITALAEPDAAYDKVVVIRVVINLGDWDAQARAIQECTRVLRPGGLLLLSEATLQGWRNLNGMRAEWGLPEIPTPAFNTYLDERQVVEAAHPELELVEIVDFASTYFVMSRVVKPLLANVAGASIDVADPTAHWNRWASKLPAAGDYGTQKLFVFRRS
jgi:ubiquinone/menaquinone biosynthesis C-methylase UbiE